MRKTKKSIISLSNEERDHLFAVAAQLRRAAEKIPGTLTEFWGPRYSCQKKGVPGMAHSATSRGGLKRAGEAQKISNNHQDPQP